MDQWTLGQTPGQPDSTHCRFCFDRAREWLHGTLGSDMDVYT